MGFWAFLRVLGQHTILFARLVWPTLGLLAAFAGLYELGRRVGKLQEQRAIKKHLPQAVRDEIEERDVLIARLERANRELREEGRRDKAKLRMVRELQERVMVAATTEPSELLEYPEMARPKAAWRR